MIDKNAIMNAAQKFTSKGQIDKAISEWEKLLEERKDGNVYNTIGDLYLRKGSEHDAKETFTKAAEVFRKDGFYPKAIAIYKKVLNLAPNDVDALIALAKLNADKGLTGNAIENYYRAAEIYNREGSTEKATRVVEKMLQLSPSDVGTRSKIAHLYFRIGLRARAANEYASIALIYLEKDNLDKAKEFFDKAFEYDPGNVSALIGLSKLALKSDNQDEAFDSLDTALSQDPNNKEVLLTYAKLAIDSDRIEDAQRALALLIDIDPLNVETKKLLATFHLKEDRFENAWEELLPVIDDALDDEKWSDAQELLQHFIEHYPVPVRQRLLRICRAQGDDTAIASELKELAALHEIEGSKQDALQLYKEALERNPDDSISAEKIKDLEVHEETAQPAIEPSSENQMAPEENTVSIPEHNEVSFPEMETVNEIHIDTGENAADTVEEKIKLDDSLFATAEPENENMSHPDETTPAHIPEIELNNITSPEQRETISLPQGPQALSDEEFAEQKSEADFYMQQGLEDEAVEIYKRLAAARPDDSEITNKLASLRPGSTEHADNPVKKSDEKQISHDSVDDDLTALFARLDEPEAEKIDYEARYTAGLEFKQKGLLDEAIKELQVAAKDPEKKQRNATMLALCYMEKGSYPLAIAEFNKVVDSMSPSASTYLHVKYELANAHLKNKDYARALELFSEVHGKDPDFKDVSARLDALKAQQSPAPEGTPKPKRDRVSYI